VEQDSKYIIRQLTKSLRISVLLNLFMALAMLLGAVLVSRGWSPPLKAGKWKKWFEKASPYAVLPDLKPDSMTDAVARQLTLWRGPDADYAPAGEEGDLIRYGRDLVAQTAVYLGPNGKIAQITNGMNCQNCHLDAGTKPWGNNYGAVASTYPKFRERSGTVEDLYKRITDCMERSLNGRALPEDSREIRAMTAYIEWLGKDVPKKQTPNGAGIFNLAFLDRPADPEKGQAIFKTKCQNCHGADGAGMKSADGGAFLYPPLWGPNSYNTGAGLYRLSRLAGYAKYNMPLGATFQNPQLSDEEAWDVAAFINSQPRPAKDLSADWPKLLGKPVDHPFGPYADGFSEKQHKYGPFGPIRAKIAELKKKN
jgi:thiosulfate dehydrogenase